MKKDQIQSISELKEYIRINNLQNSFGVTRFNAEIYIETSKSKNIFNSEIGVEFSGYNSIGTLTIYNNDIDPLVYPTQFSAEWQKYEINNEGNLYISGIHSQNLDIGRYKVIIKKTEK